jgi:hypothetical protein
LHYSLLAVFYALVLFLLFRLLNLGRFFDNSLM